MDKRLILLTVVTVLALTFSSFPDGALSVLLVAALSIPAIFIMRKFPAKGDFLVNVFLLGLILRIALGVIIDQFDLINVFGPDAYTYNNLGLRLSEIWAGVRVPDDGRTLLALSPSNTGWGMIRLVAVLYTIFGQSLLVAQSFCAFFGALTAPMIYFCAEKIFNNRRVSTFSALAIAVFPSFIIWSSQLLKDGLIVFLLVCTMVLTLQLQRKMNYLYVFLLILSVYGVYALRFYIFYMLAISIVGSFFIGSGSTINLMIRNIVIIVFIGLGLTYLGVIRSASDNFEQFGNLEKIQLSRQDLSSSADSGFGGDADVSTVGGAISAIPIGLLYLMFAPFPWQISKMSQAVIVPETLVWWCLIPIMFIGIKYTLKNKFRTAIPIIIFSLMLTLSYSLFQGNVGMLYRQRIQIQVFLFIFIAVGWALFAEKRENKKLALQAKNAKINKHLKDLSI